MTPLWAKSRPSMRKGWVLRGTRLPVEAYRTWATKVAESIRFAFPREGQVLVGGQGRLVPPGAAAASAA